MYKKFIQRGTEVELQQKIAAMRKGGRILGNLLRDLKAYVRPGMTGKEVDAWVRRETVKRGGKVAYDYLEEDFPGAICISVNDEIVHGIPTDYAFEEGDKVSFDMDLLYDGYYTDAGFTMLVGSKGSPAVKQMIKTTEAALAAGINEVRAGAKIGDIGYAVEKVLRKGKLGVIENYVGHGIGKEMHESPEVPNYGVRGHGYTLKVGDTICIEPMASLGKATNYVDPESGWAVKLKDGSVGCYCEHTILVTEDGAEILTLAD